MIFCCNFPLSCTLVLLRPCFVKKNKRYKRFTWVSYFESMCLPCRVHTRFKNLILIIVHKEYRGMHSVQIKKNEILKCQAWIFYSDYIQYIYLSKLFSTVIIVLQILVHEKNLVMVLLF